MATVASRDVKRSGGTAEQGTVEALSRVAGMPEQVWAQLRSEVRGELQEALEGILARGRAAELLPETRRLAALARERLSELTPELPRLQEVLERAEQQHVAELRQVRDTVYHDSRQEAAEQRLETASHAAQQAQVNLKIHENSVKKEREALRRYLALEESLQCPPPPREALRVLRLELRKAP